VNLVAEEEEIEYEVEIIDRREIVTYPRIRQPLPTIAVTYVAADLPPETIFIPKEEYTAEEEKKRIRKRIEERLVFKPEVYKV